MSRLIPWLFAINHPDPDTQRRGRLIVVCGLAMVFGTLAGVLVMRAVSPHLTGLYILLGLAALLCYITGMWLAHSGRVGVAGVLIISVMTMVVGWYLIMIPSHAIFSFYFILPLLLSSLVMRPRAIWVTLMVTLLITTLVARATPGTPLLVGPLPIFWPLVFLELLVTVIGFLTGRATVGALTEALRARLSAEHAASQLERANADLESHVALRTRELQAALGDVEDRANEQERLLKENEQQRQIIRELSVPVLPITDDTLVMPLIGALDSARLMDIQQTALEAIERNAARRLLLDITGVPVVDSQVAQGLMSAVQAAWLLGAEIMLVGIRPEVAQAIVGLGLALERVRTFSDLRSALLASAQASSRAAPAQPDSGAARANTHR